jgi:hypothetical protein
MLGHVPKIAFTLDGWTSPFQDAFLGVTAHWIDHSWQQKEIILGFEPMNVSHTAEALLQTFIIVVERYGLQKKVMTITTDNASNVLKMMKLLEEHTRKNSSEW